MSLINMLNWWQWAILAAVPPLVVMLYFLKLRRLPVQVPSTYLWRRTIEDLHVNSIWQRLRKNVLLLLQLLVLLAIILACLRPGYRGDATLGDRSILLIDNSSSMQASDVAPSRLQSAQEEAERLIAALGPRDVAMVIAFSDRADVRQGFTSDKKKLRAAVASIPATSHTTDLNEALRAASGLANPGRTSQIEDLNDIQVAEAMPANVYILSDGGFPSPQLDLGNLTAEYIALGSQSPENVAIVAFTAERNIEKNGRVEAFGRLQNFGSQPQEVTASLYLGDQLLDAAQVALDAGASSGLSFEIGDLVEGRLRLEIDAQDDLLLDNRAFAGLDPPRELQVVLATPGNSALLAAMATEQIQSLASVRVVDPVGLESPEMLQLAQSGQIDLFIYDRCAPPKSPESNTLYLGSLPPGQAWTAEPPQGPLFIIDINRVHPMLQYVEMGTVRIVEGQSLQVPAGGTELLRSDAGVLMAVAPRRAYQDAVLAMPLLRETPDGDVANTDWTIKRSFPVFMFNALEYLGGAVSTSGSRSVQPGQAVALGLAPRFDRVRVTTPSGKVVDIDRGGQTQLIFTQTDELGNYQAAAVPSGRLLRNFSVNLFSERESSIAVAPDLQIGAQKVAAQALPKNIVRIEAWRWLLLAALIVLCVEWIIYNRRIAV